MTEAASWGECGHAIRTADEFMTYLIETSSWTVNYSNRETQFAADILNQNCKAFIPSCKTATVAVTCCWILNLPGEIKESHTGFNEAMAILLIFKGWGWRYSMFYWFSWKDQTKPTKNCLCTQSLTQLTQCVCPIDLHCCPETIKE